jgi:hypothetical protein
MRTVVAAVLFLLAAASSACTTTAGVEPASTPPLAAQSISMRTHSWGELVSEWRIERGGDGTYASATPIPGGSFRDYDVVVRRFSAGPGAFARIETLLRPAEGGFECEVQITDGPYGTMEWSFASAEPITRTFNYGCLSDPARQAYAGMVEAERLVAGWAGGGEIVATRQVREPRPQP